MTLHPPHRPANAFCAGGGHTRWVEKGGGWGVNILEDARHSSVVYICKYFVRSPFKGKIKKLSHLVETRVKCHQLHCRKAAGGMRSCVRSSPPVCRAGRGRRAGVQWRVRRGTPTRTQPAPRRSPSPPAGRLDARPAGGVGYSPGSGGQNIKNVQFS